MSNGKYTQINSEKITSNDETNGYYKVRESTYNGTNLYLVTSDKSIGEVTLKIQENRVDYFATIYPIYGEFDRQNGEMRLCSTCKPLYNNSSTSLTETIKSGIGSIYRTNSSEPYTCYEYTKFYTTKNSSVNKAILYDNDGKYVTEITVGSITVNGTSYPRTNVCNLCNGTCSGWQNHILYSSSGWPYCECGYSSFQTVEEAEKHFDDEHIFSEGARFRFDGWEACEGKNGSAKISGCGTWLPAGYYHSQGLYIISSTKTKQSNELKLETELKFSKSVSVKKRWSDSSNEHKTRPDSITVTLLANGEIYKTLTLSESNNWTVTFEDLPSLSDSGTSIEYTIQEESVTGYTTTISGNQTDGYTITNTLQTVSVPVTKVWDDADNQDGLRKEITAILKADGAQKQTVTLNTDNNWTYTFTGLPKYNNNGTEIVYTVDEKEIPTDYTKTINGFTITNKHTPEVIDIPVTKVWDDANDQDGLRPESITLILKADEKQIKTHVLKGDNEADTWTYTFTGLPKYKKPGIEIKYTIDEQTTPTGYTKTINGFTITNKHTPEVIDIPVTKVWNDNNNQDGLRPSSITITLYKDGEATDKTLTLSESNNWIGTFEDLPKYKNHRTEIKYTVVESGASAVAYDKSTTGTQATGYTVTNILKTIDIPVTKVWNDINNRDGLRPKSITVTLYENGTATTKTAQLSESNNWKYTFKDLPEYKDEKKVVYTVEETGVPTGNAKYTTEITGNQEEGYTITNIHYDGYIEITGKVWLDGRASKTNDINGTYGSEDENKKFDESDEIKITLKDANGKDSIKATYTDENGNLTRTDYAIPNKEDGTYTIRVNYDNSNNVYKLYADAKTVEQQVYGTDSNGDGVYENYAYIEFEYNGIKYTTVATATSGENTSKAVEDEDARTGEKGLDKKYSTVTPGTKYPESENITASTQSIIKSLKNYSDQKTINSTEYIKYCDGNGKYEQTNLEDASGSITTGTHSCPNCTKTGHELKTYNVEVQLIENVNLGLFEREQPDVAIISDLTRVDVEINNQKYTYLYGVKSNENNNVGLQVEFQDKKTYIYERPVNPADIAYLNTVNSGASMSVLVTYEVKVANLSTTLPVTVNSIINAYDSEYAIDSIFMGSGENKKVVTYDESKYYDANDKFKEVTLKNLGINLSPGHESQKSDVIQLTYKVSIDAIKSLLEKDATLNNAVEIGSYSTRYGADTIYAEGRTGGRMNEDGTGWAYGGYDYNSHPGNAEIFYSVLKMKTDKDIEQEVDILRSQQAIKDYLTATGEKIEYLSEIEKENKYLEDDTDFAPSFTLKSDETALKTLSGTVWEDTDANPEDNERLGDGYYSDNEEKVNNIKIELYNVDGELADLYQKNESGEYKPVPAVVYTGDDDWADGEYAFEGVVTGVYFIKITYGNDTDATDENGSVILENGATTIDGTTTINARNYKSTIITDSIIENVLKKDYADFSEKEKKWHITHEDNYSVAVDNMQDRLEIEDLTYYNFDTGVNMTAYTKPFETQVEFEATGQSQVGVDGKVANVLNKLDFGIAERPREDLYVQKTINNFRIVLANGQVLSAGNPNDPNANIYYAKAIGFNQVINSGKEARNALEKQLLVEMDAELIQGAHLEVEYSVKVTNNNEIDYDYGVEGDYTDIVGSDTIGEYITKSSKAKYYYYGDSTGLDKMQATIEFVDYIDNELVYEEDTTQWVVEKEDNLKSLICEDAYNVLVADKYIALQPASGDSITLARGASFEQNMSAKKVISNNNENVFDNNAEILKIDGKTARTIQESARGEQVTKTYIPGNYVPSLQSESKEQDDDRVKLIITPPTGITTYIIPYILIGAVGLMVIGIGIIFIKKKILIK